MAAFNRLKEATYEVHESVKVDTQDNEDHTFCGIMFPVKCKDLLPVDHISIRSLAVRGQLGPMTVWVSKEESELPPPRRGRNNNNNNNNANNDNGATSTFRLVKSHWHKIYEANHEPSPNEYDTLELKQPIMLKPGQVKAIYVHSSLPGDQAIVYDNASFYFPRGPFGRHGMRSNHNSARKPRYEDSMIQIHTGRAHVSNTAFGQMPIWGWGNAWRDHREFVGQVHYGAVYKLWNPETQIRFGPKFKEALFMLKCCQTRWESPMSRLPDECIYYILNMCRWDWFKDCPDSMKGQLQKQKAKQKQLKLEQQQREQQEEEQRRQAEAANAATKHVDHADSKPAASGCCKCPNRSDDNSETEYVDAVEELDDNNDDDEDVEMQDEDEDDDDDDDDEDYEDDDEDEYVEDEDEEDNDSEEAWEAASGYRADYNTFRFTDPEQLEEEEGDEGNDSDNDEVETAQQSWIRRQVFRALARQQDDDEDIVEMRLVF